MNPAGLDTVADGEDALVGPTVARYGIKGCDPVWGTLPPHHTKRLWRAAHAVTPEQAPRAEHHPGRTEFIAFGAVAIRLCI